MVEMVAYKIKIVSGEIQSLHEIKSTKYDLGRYFYIVVNRSRQNGTG